MNNKIEKLSNVLQKFGLLKTAKQISILKFANKKRVIVEKLGLSSDTADFILDHCGKMSVWFADQLIKIMLSQGVPKQQIVFAITPQWIYSEHLNDINSIMDWIQHPTTQGINLKELTFASAIERATEFHENLEASGGDIDYKEANSIFIDYGNGFYWAELSGGRSTEEGDRMGHCGRSGYFDTLYSLRSFQPYGRGHTINDSHVTVAYNSSNGKVYQSKGKNNSKPAEKYHKYIFDLYSKLPKFMGISPEYEGETDYKYSDMTDEQIKTLTELQPEAFSTFSGQVELVNRKIIDRIVFKQYQIELSVKEISDWIDAKQYSKGIIEKIITFDLWDLYIDVDVEKSEVKDVLFSNSSAEIRNIISKILSENSIDMEGDEVENFLIDNYKNDNEIISNILSTIRNGIINAYTSAAEEDGYKKIKNCLEEYGVVKKLDSDGAILELTLEPFIEQHGMGYVEHILENEDENDIESVFNSLISNDYNKPKLHLEQLAYPDKETITQCVLDVLQGF